VGTVYYHFPTIDELVPACSGLAGEITPPPSPEIFAGVRGRTRRIQALVTQVFSYYRRAPGLVHVFHERARFRAVEEVASSVERAVEHLATIALGDVPDPVIRAAASLVDVRTWDSFRSRGLDEEVSVRTVATLIRSLVPRS
jgi:AcrR family transcriptional regulator